MRILLVEDDERIASDVAKALKDTGYIVERATNGEDASFLAETEDFAAVVLDLGLPKLDGLTVLKDSRSQGLHIPVAILTAHSSWSEGSRELTPRRCYLAKPFRIEELLARLRQSFAAPRPRFLRRESRARPARRARHDDKGRRGLDRAFGARIWLVAYLMHRRGEVVTQSELVEQVYGSDHQSSNAIEVLLARIRKKIGSGVIETRRGFGYIVPNATQ